MKAWHLYLIRCSDNTLYTGISNDVSRRLAEHRSGRGARYLRGRGTLVLVRKIRVGGRGDALKAERRVKRMKKEQKEKLVRGKVRLKDLIKKNERW
ncbi:MAG: GIY-YIG nuclease family protein [Candidatus Aminicenantes bacterium]|nr:GIY-YIG nuclease family protein [Candidatus Aminicenantes bacterium]